MRSFLSTLGLVVFCGASAVACGGSSLTPASTGPDASVADSAPDVSASGDTSTGDAPAIEAGSGASCPDAPADAGAFCTPDQKAARWAKMITEPIALPGKAGGLDIYSWSPPTLADTEHTNCVADAYTQGSDPNYCSVSWGDTQDLVYTHRPNVVVGALLTVQNGYEGTLSFKSVDGQSSYVMGLSKSSAAGRILKNGQPIALGAWSGPAFEATVDELYRAMMATFAPSTPPEAAGTTCIGTGCFPTIGTDGSGRVEVPALSFAFNVQNAHAPEPASSTVASFTLYGNRNN